MSIPTMDLENSSAESNKIKYNVATKCEFEFVEKGFCKIKNFEL